MVPHAPITPTQNTPTVTDQKSAPRWWNGWYTAFAVFLGLYILYVIIVLGRMSMSHTDATIDDAAPRPLNAIILTALSLATILSYLAAGRLNRRRNETAFRDAVIAALETHVARGRDWSSDELPTVPNLARGSLYTASASVSLAAIHPGADALADAVAERMGGQIEEFGRREWWRGFGDCAKHGLAGAGGDVVPLARAGRPSQPPQF